MKNLVYFSNFLQNVPKIWSENFTSLLLLTPNVYYCNNYYYYLEIFSNFFFKYKYHCHQHHSHNFYYIILCEWYFLFTYFHFPNKFQEINYIFKLRCSHILIVEYLLKLAIYGHNIGKSSYGKCTRKTKSKSCMTFWVFTRGPACAIASQSQSPR